MKLHTLLDLRAAIPAFMHISDGRLHEMNVLDRLIPEPGAFYLMDRAFLDFERPYSAAVHRSSGLMCDQTVLLNVFYSKLGFPQPFRRIKIKDHELGKSIVLLINNTMLPLSRIFTARGGVSRDDAASI